MKDSTKARASCRNCKQVTCPLFGLMEAEVRRNFEVMCPKYVGLNKLTQWSLYTDEEILTFSTRDDARKHLKEMAEKGKVIFIKMEGYYA